MEFCIQNGSLNWGFSKSDQLKTVYYRIRLISHSVLLNRLKTYGIDNEELEWFACYLFCRSQVVDINNKRSNEFYIYSGVLQGSILGPLLFIISFNDFPDSLKKSKFANLR